jgi:hypothetical protein
MSERNEKHVRKLQGWRETDPEMLKCLLDKEIEHSFKVI